MEESRRKGTLLFIATEIVIEPHYYNLWFRVENIGGSYKLHGTNIKKKEVIVYRNSNDFFLMNNLDNWIILDGDGNELMTSKPITSGQMVAPVDGWIFNFNSTKENHTVHDPRVRVLPCLHPPCHQTGKMCIQIISCDKCMWSSECVWSDWSGGGECSASCAGGTRTFRRRIVREALEGSECRGENTKKEVCNRDECPQPEETGHSHYYVTIILLLVMLLLFSVVAYLLKMKIITFHSCLQKPQSQNVNLFTF